MHSINFMESSCKTELYKKENFTYMGICWECQNPQNGSIINNALSLLFECLTSQPIQKEGILVRMPYSPSCRF